MISKSIHRLEYLCATIPPYLEKIPEHAFSQKPADGGWSYKEIIGHLIDSAANNHHRFVRAQFEEIPVIFYNADNWNNHGYYSQMDGKKVISFWASYNRHLVELLKRLPEKYLQRECNTGGEKNMTLEFVINDYVEHLEHHLRQIAGLE